MERIQVTPIAFESLGVRSMCTSVETPDVRILIDAGVALGQRFRLLPHPEEYEALRKSRDRIHKCARNADVVTVSHYHHDHFTPNFVDTVWLASNSREAEAIYKGKTVILKDVRGAINPSQRRRGWIFQTFCRKIGSKLLVADSKKFEFGNTTVRFSSPLPHGEIGSELGWVLATLVEHGSEKFIHASDIEGPMSRSTLEFILGEKPSEVIIGGPPTYLAGLRVPQSSIRAGLDSLQVITSRIPLVIIDHHLLRDQESMHELAKLSTTAKSFGNQVVTAAEYLGEPLRLLEANRKALYENEPPTRQFIKWTKLAKEKQQETAPPLQQKRRKRG